MWGVGEVQGGGELGVGGWYGGGGWCCGDCGHPGLGDQHVVPWREESEVIGGALPIDVLAEDF